MSGERLDAEWVRSWCEQVDEALTKLMKSFPLTHGYPPGQNAVVLATDDSHQATSALVDLTPIPSDLTTLYWVISEASLPDIGSGYFIHSPATAAGRFREHGPAPIDGEWIAPVFASDGGQVWKSTTTSWSDGDEPGHRGDVIRGEHPQHSSARPGRGVGGSVLESAGCPGPAAGR